MPASRIAFALADFIAEAARLLPKDHKLGVAVRLDSSAFDAVIYQLAEYGGIPRQVPGAPPINDVNFCGVVIERMVPAEVA